MSILLFGVWILFFPPVPDFDFLRLFPPSLAPFHVASGITPFSVGQGATTDYYQVTVMWALSLSLQVGTWFFLWPSCVAPYLLVLGSFLKRSEKFQWIYPFHWFSAPPLDGVPLSSSLLVTSTTYSLISSFSAAKVLQYSPHL